MPDSFEIQTHNVTADGRGVARLPDGSISFIARSLAGEQVLAQAVARSRGVTHSRTLRVLHAAASRIPPACPAYGSCDGCQWLHATPDAEYSALESALHEQLERLGRLTLPAAEPAIRLPRTGSRDRLSLQLDETGTLYWLGPAVPQGSQRLRHAPWQKQAAGCVAAHPDLNAAGQQLQAALYEYWSSDLRDELRSARRAGHVPHVVLARSLHSTHAALAWGNAPLARMLDPAMHDEPLWVAQDQAHPVNPVPWYGTTIHNDPRGFFQPSLAGASALAATLRDWTTGQHVGTLFDLYGGQGLWAWALADRCERAHVVDASGYRPAQCPTQWRWQRSDLSRAQLDTRELWAGTAPQREDLVVVDPPRAGLSRAVLQGLSTCDAKRLIYISCGPDALARDLQVLTRDGQWQLRRWRVLHQFPGSGHAEVLVELVR